MFYFWSSPSQWVMDHDEIVLNAIITCFKHSFSSQSSQVFTLKYAKFFSSTLHIYTKDVSQMMIWIFFVFIFTSISLCLHQPWEKKRKILTADDGKVSSKFSSLSFLANNFLSVAWQKKKETGGIIVYPHGEMMLGNMCCLSGNFYELMELL